MADLGQVGELRIAGGQVRGGAMDGASVRVSSSADTVAVLILGTDGKPTLLTPPWLPDPRVAIAALRAAVELLAVQYARDGWQ